MNSLVCNTRCDSSALAARQAAKTLMSDFEWDIVRQMMSKLRKMGRLVLTGAALAIVCGGVAGAIKDGLQLSRWV